MRHLRLFASSAVLVSAVAFAASPAAAALAVSDTPAGVVVTVSDCALTFSREGAQLTVRRGEEVVLQGAAVTTAGGKREQPPKIGKLQKVGAELDATVLEYAIGKDAVARLELRERPHGLRVTAHVVFGKNEVQAGFAWQLAPSGLWYGGGFQGWREKHALPLNDGAILQPSFYSAATSQATPLWYTTKGVGVWMRTPMEFEYAVNRPVNGKPDGLISVTLPPGVAIEYDLYLKKDFREVVTAALQDIGRPRRVPPAEFFGLPIYATWTEYKVDVDQAKVIEYAKAIRAHGLPAGVIELDDKWEARYGDMEFTPDKFPDPKKMCDELHAMGFRVTLWVHPFVSPDSASFAKHRDDGLLLRDANGSPSIVHWWNGTTAIWDFSEPRAGELFRRRLDAMMARYGFDGFKFDGGDVHFVTAGVRPARAMTAAEYPDRYNQEMASHYAWNETRVGINSQPLGVVMRLFDKQSVWGRENGLGALIPEALTCSLRGFFYVMPDMIGGNEYDGDKPDAELMIRWAQASALMPLLQFSRGPWHHGPETVRLCREATELHLAFTPYIVKLAERASSAGEPIIAPLVYHTPDDAETFAITDQFMLGTDVLVAPVITKGATSRDVYLPRGKWRAHRGGETFEGGRWLKAYPAPLDTLPVFVRDGAKLP